MAWRKASPEELKVLGAGAPASPRPPAAKGGWRKASPDEMSALGGGDDPERPAWLTPGRPDPVDPVADADAAAAAPGAKRDYPEANAQELAEQIRTGRKNPVTSKPEAALRGGGTALPFMDEATGAVRALRDTKDIRQLPAGYRRERDKERERTETASLEHPDSFYPAAGATLLASSFTPFGGVRAAKTAKDAAVAGAKVGGLRAAADAVGRSEADLTKGEIKPLLKDVAIAGGVGAVLGGVFAGGAHKLTRGAEERAERAIIRQATDGADPTHARRLAGREGETAPAVVAFTRRHDEVGKAVGNQKKMVEATDRVVDRSAKQTAPIYDKLDREVGRVAVKDVLDHLDGEIAKQTADYGANGAIERSLKEVRERIVTATESRASQEAAAGVATRGDATMSHKDVRAWVTGLLKDELQTMGGLAETARYEIKDHLHQVGDAFLKGRLKAAAARPELADDIAKLSALNTDIAMGLKLNQAASNANARAYYANRNPLISALAGGAAGTAMGAGAGIEGAAAAYVGTQVAPSAVKGIGRAANKAVAALVRSANKGSIGARAVQAAIEEGVPVAVARGIAAAAQKRWGSSKENPKVQPVVDPIDWGPGGDVGGPQW